VVESGAGDEAGFPDAPYEEAGAETGSADEAWNADVVLRVAVPTPEEIGRLDRGRVLIGHLAPLTSPATNRALADVGVTSFAMEAIPRITRAQSLLARRDGSSR
jgi:H+-translocating NAD(P) transhydrogenase subunit alpha